MPKIVLTLKALVCAMQRPVHGRTQVRTMYRGTSLMRNSPIPWDHHKALGIVLLLGPRGGGFV